MAGWQSGHAAACKAVYAGSIPASASRIIYNGKHMKVAIIGFGFVGKALSNGILNNVDIYKVDPKLNTNIIDLIKFKPDIIFICAPTPMNDDGSQDISIIELIINKIIEFDINLNSDIVLKSTILPDNLKNLKKILPNIIYNPEFLREKHANEDFINSNLIVFGSDNNDYLKISNFYQNFTKCINQDYIKTDLTTASLLKYAINSFLATKVSFFNELNELFLKSGAEESWDSFISYIDKDRRIGSSHMNVPGHDGRKGFGGACLPKDSNALIKYAMSLNTNLNVLKKAISTNNKIRAGYNDLIEREIDQNITYKKE